MRKQTTAFYLETLVMILVFIGVILILTHIFGIAREESARAGLLTNSVALAENAAETLAGAGRPEELRRLLEERGNAAGDEDGTRLTFTYDADRTPNPDGILAVEVSWREEDGLIRAEISVSRLDTEQQLYALSTAVYGKEGL